VNRGRLDLDGEPSHMSPLSETSNPTGPELRLRYEQLIEKGTMDYDCLESNIKQLTELILAHGIPVRLCSLFSRFRLPPLFHSLC